MSDERRPILSDVQKAPAPEEEAAGVLPLVLRDKGSVKFLWNGRWCDGDEIHEAILDKGLEKTKRLEKVLSILDQDPGGYNSKFVYQTKYNGKVQEGSGLSIHLAATRDSVEIVQLLLDRRADVDAMATRNKGPHYNVLHAAIYREGNGGHFEVVRCLLENKASQTPNQNHEYPLHKAFQTGGNDAVALVELLRQDTAERYPQLMKIEEAEYCRGVSEPGTPPQLGTPLQEGIRREAMTGEQLAFSAQLVPLSLRIFHEELPRCIPLFCTRILGDDQRSITPQKFVEYCKLKDLCDGIRQSPETALSFLENLSGPPEVTNEGWHALPTKMSWAPRKKVDIFRSWFNPPRTVRSVYAPDCDWNYNAETFKAPDWHDELAPPRPPNTHIPPPVVDVKIQVCFFGDIIRAEFFSALDSSDYDGLFETPVVDAALDTVWWHGAFRVDVVQLLITMIGLLLLVLDRAQSEYLCDATHDQAPGCNGTSSSEWPKLSSRLASILNGGDDPLIISSPQEVFAQTNMFGFAAQFIGARGVVDLLHELAQLAGYIKMGRPQDYFTWGNAWDIFRAAVSWLFFVYSGATSAFANQVTVLLILLYWFRLLEINFCEKIMRELLPITSLVKGLAPSCIVCCIAVCAFTHAKWVMEPSRLWPDVCYDSFSLLITAGLPEQNGDTRRLAFSYLAVSCFTVFFLNVFISVISESYAEHKENVKAHFQKKKCGYCLTFLTRALVLPCRLLSGKAAMGVAMACVVLHIVSVATLCFASQRLRESSIVVFVALQTVWLLCCYQDCDNIWSKSPGDNRERYLWVIVPVQADESQQREERLEKELEDLQMELRELLDVGPPASPRRSSPVSSRR
mmetsp:Transcript_76524/g.221158  ORF Transcript_76524/g.221158 Transcript_76524/m.221158 type:complete len:853 (+) Transcript_76524:281-2839(+)